MVKKITKYLKFVVCCALIVSLIAPSYAALSASDGSAFVTKAEFDAALADFNSRLTTFEAGINSKIDSQVTSYLDRNGIWNGKVQDVNEDVFGEAADPFVRFLGGQAAADIQGYYASSYNSTNYRWTTHAYYPLNLSTSISLSTNFIPEASKSGLLCGFFLARIIWGQKGPAGSRGLTDSVHYPTSDQAMGAEASWYCDWVNRRNDMGSNYEFLLNRRDTGNDSCTYPVIVVTSATPIEGHYQLFLANNLKLIGDGGRVLQTACISGGLCPINSVNNHIGPEYGAASLAFVNVNPFILNLCCFVSKGERVDVTSVWEGYGRNIMAVNAIKLSNFDRQMYLGLGLACDDVKVY